MSHSPIDPRISNICFDANAFNRAEDDADADADADVDRLLALSDAGKLILLAPGGVRAETQHPRTPAAVRQAVETKIFSLPVQLNGDEQRLLAQVRAILRGNATSGQHDADAHHVFEAAKHGGYFITHDRRINRTKRTELLAVLPNLWIGTPTEFLAIYDRYAAAERA